MVLVRVSKPFVVKDGEKLGSNPWKATIVAGVIIIITIIKFLATFLLRLA